MRIVLAYRHTGETHQDLTDLLTPVRAALQAKGAEVFCTFFLPESTSSQYTEPRDFMGHAFKEIDESDILFAVQKSAQHSEGMLMEVGYCWAKQIPTVIATHTSVTKTYLPSMATKALDWSTPADLADAIANVDFTRLTVPSA